MARFELQKLYIDGGYTDAGSDATFDAINPANGEVLAQVQRATKEDVERAVVSAEKGQKIWAAMTAMERSRILRRAVDILRERNDELATLETLDTGKAFSETKYVDIVTGADVLEYYAGLVPAIEGEQIPLRDTAFVYTRREPLGVVAGIGAWNYPIQIALWKSAPALAAGNAMIFKPSEVTSLTTLKLAEIYTEAGVPNGVFNVLTGSGREVGTWLTEHPRIEKISFTGGTDTGKKVMASASASSLKDVTMELGGKSPLIICDDADLELALCGGSWASWLHQGQICMSAGRHLVHKDLAETYAQRMAEKAKALPVGDPHTQPVALGPIITPAQLQRVDRIVQDSIRMGARLLAGGTPNGQFYPATVLAEVTPDMPVFREEIFGPVVSITAFGTDAEAVALANDTEYGLSAGVHTRDVGRGMGIVEQLHVGLAHVNDQTVNDDGTMPMGGRGASGNGSRHGGPANWDEFTQWQWTTVRNAAPAYPL